MTGATGVVGVAVVAGVVVLAGAVVVPVAEVVIAACVATRVAVVAAVTRTVTDEPYGPGMAPIPKTLTPAASAAGAVVMAMRSCPLIQDTAEPPFGSSITSAQLDGGESGGS